jgi:hypothetical protein
MTMFWTGAAAKMISTTRCCCARPARFDPPRYLKPGNVVEVEADSIGQPAQRRGR